MQPYYNQVDPCTLQFLDLKLFAKLCVRLDGNNSVGRGWEALAPKLGLTDVYVIRGGYIGILLNLSML